MYQIGSCRYSVGRENIECNIFDSSEGEDGFLFEVYSNWFGNNLVSGAMFVNILSGWTRVSNGVTMVGFDWGRK